MDRATSAPAQETTSDAEAALWAELEKDVADPVEDVEDEAEAPAKTEKEAEPEETEETAEEKAETDAKAKPPLAYEELDKRYKQLQGALGEERGTRRQLTERLQQMETVIRTLTAQRQGQQPAQEAQQPQIPDIETDPVGYFKYKLAETEARLAEVQQHTTKTVQQIEQERTERAFWSSVAQSEQEIRKAVPDYDDAVGFLEQARVRELEVMLPDDSPQAMRLAEQRGFGTVEELRAAMLNHDRISVATQAMQIGMSPAQLYYNLAQQRGWQQKPAAPMKAAPKLDAIKATKAGQQAAKSIGGAAAARTTDDMTLDDLASLYLDDPDKADKVFKRMKDKGLLG